MKLKQNVRFVRNVFVLFFCFARFQPVAFAAQNTSPRPNVLIVIADDWGLHASAYGTPWISTPAFDRIAREGFLFRNAFTPNAKCAPSRAILLTGRQSWQLEDAGNHMAFFPTKFSTFPEALSRSGINVGTTGKGWAPGIANDEQGKPREVCGKLYQARKQTPPTKAISNNDYAANFDDFLDASSPDTPWCFWAGGAEPHRAYEYGSGSRLASKPLSAIDKVPSYWPDNETVRNDMLDYALEVEHLDRHLDRMYKSLERRNLLENTLIIVTSDHGMPFPRVKGQAYVPSNQIPLAMRCGSKILKPGSVIYDYVNFTDIAPTVFDFLQVDSTAAGMQPMSGRSLRPLFVNTKELTKGSFIEPARDHVIVGMERHDAGRPHDWGYPIRGIIKDSFFYLHNFANGRFPAGNPETGYLNCDGGATKSNILASHRTNGSDPFWKRCFGHRPSEELYDLSKDPDCIDNLAGRPSHVVTQRNLQEVLHRDLVEQEDPRILKDGSVFDAYPIAMKDSKNFYDRFINGQPAKAGWVNSDDYETAKSIIHSPSAPAAFPLKLNQEGTLLIDQHEQPFTVIGQRLHSDYLSAAGYQSTSDRASDSRDIETRWALDLDDQARRGINSVLIECSENLSHEFDLNAIKAYCELAQRRSISVWIDCYNTGKQIDKTSLESLANVIWIQQNDNNQTDKKESNSNSSVPVFANRIDASKIQVGKTTLPILSSRSNDNAHPPQSGHEFREALWSNILSNASGFFVQLDKQPTDPKNTAVQSSALRDIARLNEIIGGMNKSLFVTEASVGIMKPGTIKPARFKIELTSDSQAKSNLLVQSWLLSKTLSYVPHSTDASKSVRPSRPPKSLSWIDPTNGETWVGVPEGATKDGQDTLPVYKLPEANAQGDHDWLVVIE